MTYRFEFEAPLEKGRRRVRAYDGDECVMSGVLEPRRVEVTPAHVVMFCANHESRPQAQGGEDHASLTRARKMREAIAQLEGLMNP